VTVSRSVQLRTPRGPIGWGELCDVSLSGAFIQTTVAVTTLAQVQVVFSKEHPREPLRIDAQVVRRTPVGIGLEWDESGEEDVKKLMANLERRAPRVRLGHEHPRLRRRRVI
jgi:hypothetical protein